MSDCEQELVVMNECNFLVDNAKVISRWMDYYDELPLYAIRYIPDNDKYAPMYLKFPRNSAYREDAKPSFTRDIWRKTGLNVVLFKDEASASEALIKLTLLGKSRRRDLGNYEVMKLGAFPLDGYFSIKKRIKQEWIERGVAVKHLIARNEDHKVWEDKNFDPSGYHLGYYFYDHEDWIFNDDTHEYPISKVCYREANGGDAARNFDIDEFSINDIYAVLYENSYPFRRKYYYRVYPSHAHPLWAWAYLTDKYNVSQLKIGESRVIPAPFEGIEEYVKLSMRNDGTHTEFGMTFNNDVDPFFEYVVTRKQ